MAKGLGLQRDSFCSIKTKKVEGLRCSLDMRTLLHGCSILDIAKSEAKKDIAKQKVIKEGDLLGFDDRPERIPPCIPKPGARRGLSPGQYAVPTELPVRRRLKGRCHRLGRSDHRLAALLPDPFRLPPFPKVTSCTNSVRGKKDLYRDFL